MENTSAAELVARDTPCFRCGYNLRGLPLSGRCPECGEAVELSQKGRHLAMADPRWRRRLRLGAALHAGALIVALLVVLALFSMRGRGLGLLTCYLPLAVAISLGATGAWLTTSPEPGGPYFDDGRWFRYAVRLLAVLSWCGMVGYTAIQAVDWRPLRSFGGILLGQEITGITGFGGGLVVTGLAIWHLSRLAKRLGQDRLVFYGRLSTFSPAIMVVTIFGVLLLLNYYRIDESSLEWLAALLYGILFLWPATYQMVWRHYAGAIRL